MPALLLYISIFSTGTLFGAFWATRRRENWLRDHQPLDSIWDTPEYDRLTARYRARGVL